MVEIHNEDGSYFLCTYCDGDAILVAKTQESQS
jgi:hypothetical protein